MMSRITLHLKKEAHRVPDPLATHNAFDLTSSMVASGRDSPITFAPDSSQSNSAPLTVTVEEHSITFDDRGREVRRPEKSHQQTHIKKDSKSSSEAEEEWLEFADMGQTRRRERRVEIV